MLMLTLVLVLVLMLLVLLILMLLLIVPSLQRYKFRTGRSIVDGDRLSQFGDHGNTISDNLHSGYGLW